MLRTFVPTPSPPAKPRDSSLYHRFFTPAERRRLRSAPASDPSSEIALIRILLRRVLQACSDSAPLDLETQAGVLSAFSQAGLTMAALARLSARLHYQQLLDASHGRTSIIDEILACGESLPDEA